MRHTVDTVP